MVVIRLSWLTDPRRLGYVLLVPVLVIASGLVPRELSPYLLALCYGCCILQVGIAIVDSVRQRAGERDRLAAASGVDSST